MSSDSQELLSQPLHGDGSGGGRLDEGWAEGGRSGGGRSGGGSIFSVGASAEVPVSTDLGPVLDISTLLTNAVSPLLAEIKKLQKEVRIRLLYLLLEMFVCLL